MKRTPFKAKRQERTTRPERAPVALVPPLAWRQPTLVDGRVRSVVKTVANRSSRLLGLARGMSCLLQVPGHCRHDHDTTVAAHSNWPEHGKAGARKADDCFSVWACHRCHSWLDQGMADGQYKRLVFDVGHRRQTEEWARLAADPSLPEPDRAACRWALDLIAATTAANDPASTPPEESECRTAN